MILACFFMGIISNAVLKHPHQNSFLISQSLIENGNGCLFSFNQMMNEMRRE